jgi:hypothetical protein
MSEETQNDGTWSGLKKTIIGTLSTAVLAGGTWFTTTLFGGHEEESKEETKTEQASPASAAPVIVNVQQSQENKQQVKQGSGTVVRERIIEKPVEKPAPAKAQPENEEDPW